jgi:hypothetical protein
MTSKEHGACNCQMQKYEIHAYVHVLHILHTYCMYWSFVAWHAFLNTYNAIWLQCAFYLTQTTTPYTHHGTWWWNYDQPTIFAPPSRSGQQAGMPKIIQAVGGTTHDIDKAIRAMDAHFGPNPIGQILFRASDVAETRKVKTSWIQAKGTSYYVVYGRVIREIHIKIEFHGRSRWPLLTFYGTRKYWSLWFICILCIFHISKLNRSFSPHVLHKMCHLWYCSLSTMSKDNPLVDS